MAALTKDGNPIRNKIRDPLSDKVFFTINAIVLGIFGLMVLYPLIYVVSCSFSSGYAVITNKVWLWPVEPTLDAYGAILKHRLLMSGYLNAFLYMVGGTTVNLILIVLAAYPLSRSDMPGRGFFTFVFMFTMFFNGGMIPDYLLVRNLRLLNTRWALIIPFMLSAYNIILVRTFFKSTIPTELLDAAHIDSCSDLQFFWRIALPLSKPILAVMVLFCAVGHWNGYFRALLYLSDSDLYPLQLVLRDILFVTQMPDSILMAMGDSKLEELSNLQQLLKYSVIVVASAPLMILYPFIQKYFVKGVMIGSLKG